MPLQRGIVPVPLSGGVDTKSDPKFAGSGSSLEVENGVFRENGSIHKRYGYTRQVRTTSSGGTLSTLEYITETEDGLLGLDGNYAYRFSEQENEWVLAGLYPKFSVKTDTTLRNISESQRSANAVVSGNYLLIVWEDSTWPTTGGTNPTLRYTIREKESGRLLVDDTQLVAGHSPILKAVGSEFWLLYRTSGTTTLSVKRLTFTTSLTTVSTFTLSGVTLTQSDSIYHYDFDAYDSDSIAVVYYGQHSTLAATDSVTVGIFDNTGAVEGSVYSLLDANYGEYPSINVDGADTIYIWYQRINSTSYHRRVLDSAVSSTATTAYTIDIYQGDRKTPIWKNTNGTIYFCADNKVVFGTLSGDVVNPTYNLTPCSDVFTYNNVTYGLAVYLEEEVDATYVLVAYPETSDDEFNRIHSGPVGVVLQGLAASSSDKNHRVTVVNEATGVYSFYVTERKNFVTSSPDNEEFTETSIAKVTIDFVTHPYTSTRLNDITLLGGSGWPGVFDGANVSELQFLGPPSKITAAAGSGTSSPLPAGDYSYKTITEWVDAKGNLQRSADSPTVTVTSDGTNETEIGGIVNLYSDTTSTPSYIRGYVSVPTRKRRPTMERQSDVVIYRSVVDDASTFYRLLPPGDGNLYEATTVVDDETDANIQDNEIPYISGGVVPNYTPPGGRAMTFGLNRLFIANTERDNEIWYSQELLQEVAPETSSSLVEQVDPIGQDITALAYMDAKLIIFKENHIFALSGDGPNPTGLDNTFSKPSLVPADVGCVDVNSVVLIPSGVLFKSNKGIYLLDRSLQANYVGAPVESYNSDSITGAVLLEDVNEVRFTTDNSNVLVYNYYYDKWSVFTGINATSCCLWNDKFTWCDSDGYVYTENTSYQDNATNIDLKVTTPWIRIQTTQGYQRVYFWEVLGEYKSTHDLVVKVAYDYVDSYVETNTFDTSGFSTGDPPYQIGKKPARQKCQSIKFEISDSGSNTGESVELSEIALSVGIKPGLNRNPRDSST